MTGAANAADAAGLVPPEFLRVAAATDEARARRLPARVVDALTTWELSPDGPSRHGRNALVIPVRRRDNTRAALRLDRPRPETSRDHLALRAWAGFGAVTLLAADPAAATTLVERLDADTDLTSLSSLEACVVVGRLLARLDRPALSRVPSASTLTDDLSATLRAALRTRPVVPRRFVEQALALVRDLGRDAEERLTPTALTFDNVLAASGDRPGGPWAAASPAALRIERAYGVWPVLRERWGQVGGDVRWEVHSRLGAVCDAAGVDEDRARGWALVRTIDSVLRASHAPSSTSAPDPWPSVGMDVTDAVTLLKALQPGA